MQKSDISHEQYERLTQSIFLIITQKGPKATTMDFVAQRLGMSKRTLYELFGSKEEMLTEVLSYQKGVYEAKVKEIMTTAPNMMEAVANVFLLHMEFLRDINPRFFFDMDVRYHNLRDHYTFSQNFLKVFEAG